MAFHNISLAAVLAIVAQLGNSTIATAVPDSGPMPCIGTKSILDTIGIVTDRKTGAQEQSLVEARLAIVSHEIVVGTMYIDDQGMRYIEIKRGATVPGLADMHGDGAVHPFGLQRTLSGEARLRACQGDRT